MINHLQNNVCVCGGGGALIKYWGADQYYTIALKTLFNIVEAPLKNC